MGLRIPARGLIGNLLAKVPLILVTGRRRRIVMINSYDHFAADLPKADSIAFSSLEENEEVLKSYGINQEMKQLGKGKFSSALASRRYGETELYSDRYNVAASMTLEPPADTVAFLFPRTASGRFLASGVDLGNEKLLVLPQGSATDIVGPALIGSDSILMPTQHFHELSERLCPNLEPIESLHVVTSELVRHLKIRDAIPAMIGQPESSDDPEAFSQLLALLISSLETSGDRQTTDRLTNAARIRIAHRAKDYIEHNFQQTIRMDEVCQDADAGLRTLQRAFLEYFSVSFTQYLKLVRLNALQRDLRAAVPSEWTIAELGSRNGFCHLGRLSVDFHQQFGKTPSETLRCAL
jgi:AraC-like DNA-binding protein